MTKKSVPVTVCFGIITVAQLMFGVYLLIVVARDGGKVKFLRSREPFSPKNNCVAQKFPDIPLDSYRMCIFIRHRYLEIVYTSISLIYGLLKLSYI